MKAKLQMVIGVQRSGTNALFDSIARGGGCIPMVDVAPTVTFLFAAKW